MRNQTLPKFKRCHRRRKPLILDVNCSVRVIVGGRTIKTVKRKMTLNRAVREIGKDPVSTEGRLLTRVPLNVSRKIVRGVRVVLMYVWNGKASLHEETVTLPPMDWQGFREVVKAKVPL